MRSFGTFVCVAVLAVGCRNDRRPVAEAQIARDLIGKKIHLSYGPEVSDTWTIEPDEIRSWQTLRRITDPSAGTDVIYAAVRFEGGGERAAGRVKVIYTLANGGWRFDKVLADSEFTHSGPVAGARSGISAHPGVYSGPPIRRIRLITQAGVLGDELALGLHRRGFAVETAAADPWCTGEAEVIANFTHNESGAPAYGVLEFIAVGHDRIPCPTSLVATVSWQNGRGGRWLSPHETADEVLNALFANVVVKIP